MKFKYVGLTGIALILILFITYSHLLKKDLSLVSKNEHHFKALVKKQADWGRYTQLSKAVAKVKQNWDGTKLLPLTTGAVLSSSERIAISRQTATIKDLFYAEEQRKQINLDSALKEFRRKRSLQLTAKLKDMVAILNRELDLELQNKDRANDKLLLEYQHKLQMGQQLTLTNLQIQLAVADLLQNQDERNKLQLQQKLIQQDISRKITSYEQLLKNEQTTFEKQKRLEITSKFKLFKSEQEAEFQLELDAYKGKLQSEFETWHNAMEQELHNAIEIRQEETSK